MSFKREKFGDEYFEITRDTDVSNKILTLVKMTQRNKCVFSPVNLNF